MKRKLNFEKGNGLIPVIIQDFYDMQVLMLGYMNKEAYAKTKRENIVTFFSRTKNRLWTKGEESGNFLKVINMAQDCDQDTLLINVIPTGPTCHLGTKSCFNRNSSKGFLYQLEKTIKNRIDDEAINSYTYRLFKKGINKMAQKLGEEAVELVIESKDENEELFKGEAADLLYHFILLLNAKKCKLQDVEQVLLERALPKN